MDQARRHAWGAEVPDMTGWDVMDQLLWYADNGRLNELIAEINRDDKGAANAPERAAPEQATPLPALPPPELPPLNDGRTAEAPAAGKRPRAARASAKARAPGPMPDFPPLPTTLGYTPDADEQRRIDYRNEHARWRLRRAEDYDWEQERGGLIHEYDVLGEE